MDHNVRKTSQKQKLIIDEILTRRKKLHEYIDSLELVLGVDYKEIATARIIINEGFDLLITAVSDVD